MDFILPVLCVLRSRSVFKGGHCALPPPFFLYLPLSKGCLVTEKYQALWMAFALCVPQPPLLFKFLATPQLLSYGCPSFIRSWGPT